MNFLTTFIKDFRKNIRLYLSSNLRFIVFLLKQTIILGTGIVAACLLSMTYSSLFSIKSVIGVIHLISMLFLSFIYLLLIGSFLETSEKAEIAIEFCNKVGLTVLGLFFINKDLHVELYNFFNQLGVIQRYIDVQSVITFWIPVVYAYTNLLLLYRKKNGPKEFIEFQGTLKLLMKKFMKIEGLSEDEITEITNDIKNVRSFTKLVNQSSELIRNRKLEHLIDKLFEDIERKDADIHEITISFIEALKEFDSIS